MINNNLLTGIAKMLAGESYTIPSYLAFGSTTGTITATDTSASGEFDRNALDSDDRTDYTIKYIGRRLSTEAGSETINNVALVNSSTLASTGNIQANALIASLVHTTSFDVDVEFWITISRG